VIAPGGPRVGLALGELAVQLEGRLVLVQRFLEAAEPTEGLAMNTPTR